MSTPKKHHPHPRPQRSYATKVEGESVARLLARYLTLEGVDTIFGIPGGGVANLLTELKNDRNHIEYIVCRQETGAAYIADGYHRATGTLGVVLVTTGPGATNALTGAMNAQADGSALMVITGEVSEQYYGMGYLQEGIDASLNVNAIFASAVRNSSVVSDQSNFQTLFTGALRDALSIPRGAVHVSMPDNVAAETVLEATLPHAPSNYRATPHGCAADQDRGAGRTGWTERAVFSPARTRPSASAPRRCGPVARTGKARVELRRGPRVHVRAVLNGLPPRGRPGVADDQGRGLAHVRALVTMPGEHEHARRKHHLAPLLHGGRQQRGPPHDGVLLTRPVAARGHLGVGTNAACRTSRRGGDRRRRSPGAFDPAQSRVKTSRRIR